MSKKRKNVVLEKQETFDFIDQFAKQHSNSVDLPLAFQQFKSWKPEFSDEYSDFSIFARERIKSQGYVNKQVINKAIHSEFDKPLFDLTIPRFTFENVAGLDSQKEEFSELIKLPLVHRELFEKIGTKPIHGILLNGPSGCGKSLLVEAVAGEFASIGLNFIRVFASDLIVSAVTQSESRLRALFKSATSASPCLLFIDGIETLSNKKTERRLLNQLVACFDFIDSENVFVVGATSHIDEIDATLRRSGRFTREISIGIPDCNHRQLILETLCSNIQIEEINFALVAQNAEGYLGSDLRSLIDQAAFFAVKRSASTSEEPRIISQDFLDAHQMIQPSLRREGFTTLPPALFDNIGGLENVKAQLQSAIIDAILRPEVFEFYGHKPASGVLLFGPPGCGKTLLARAVAYESNRAAFISVKGPELLNRYLGESELAVRNVFSRARNSAPCIIFFDEIDSLCPRRSEESTNAAASRVVNQILTEMDGVIDRGRVFVIGATNRPELVDEAMLRPGRLDKKIFVPAPNLSGRIDIFKRKLSKIKNIEVFSLEQIGETTENFTGAEIDLVIKEAIEDAIQKGEDGSYPPLSIEHLQIGVQKVIEYRHVQLVDLKT